VFSDRIVPVDLTSFTPFRWKWWSVDKKPTAGFIKKTEKVPLSEIRKALKIKKNQEE
jgi:hypothetical protein